MREDEGDPTIHIPPCTETPTIHVPLCTETPTIHVPPCKETLTIHVPPCTETPQYTYHHAHRPPQYTYHHARRPLQYTYHHAWRPHNTRTTMHGDPYNTRTTMHGDPYNTRTTMHGDPTIHVPPCTVQRESSMSGSFSYLTPNTQDMETGEFHAIHPVVSKQQTLDIYDPIEVSPKRVVILWDPTNEFHYQYLMKVGMGFGCVCY